MNANATGKPLPALEKSEIPTLIFGARTHLPHAGAFIITLGDDPRLCRAWLAALAPDITYGHQRRECAAVLALTAAGLLRLGLPEDELAAFPTAFQSGMTGPGRSRVLGDVGVNAPENWQWGHAGAADGKPECHAILILYGASADDVTASRAPGGAALAKAGGKVITHIVLPERARAGGYTTEPFGFADGISQPIIRGTPRAAGLGQDKICPAGAFILGYEGDNSDEGAISATIPRGRDRLGILPAVTCADGIVRADLGRNGSFLVVRQLQQHVERFASYTEATAQALPGRPTADWLAAKLVGRWKNGASLVRHPNAPGRHADNDFLFRYEDPYGLGCPLGAHIRRANPRDSLTSDAAVSRDITNRHRLLRVGRPYADGEAQGILFMCINADIEMQFETVQQSWLNRTDFHGLRNETDPLTGGAPDASQVYTIPTDAGPLRLRDLPDFVTVVGGGYFFMPSRAAIKYLAALGPPAI